MKLGKAFSDSVERVGRRPFRSGTEATGAWWLGSGRALLFATLLLLFQFVLLWRLFDLTVIGGHRFRALADGNRTRELIRQAPRGRILDRTGKPLTANRATYRLYEPCERGGESPEQLCERTLGHEEARAVTEKNLSKGAFLVVEYEREYVYSEVLAHVVGYTGELSERELGDEYYKLRNYRLGDRVGRSGAEAVFEERLRGRDGRELVEVDAAGRILRSLGRDPEQPGEDVMLSVDAGLAEAVERAFPKDLSGAVVVAKPSTGEILALYSSPSYNPNAFTMGMTNQEYEALLTDPKRPLFQRALGGLYPPGSTFKIVTAVAALEEGAIRPDTTVEDVGVVTIGPFTFPNWYFVQYGKTEGMVDIVKAIQRSNDIFFYKVGEWVGITKLSQWARRLGVGTVLGIELGGEAKGLMPDPSWKNLRFTSEEDLRARNNEWYLGDTYHVAIGQGYLLTTPLQVNTWTNVMANGGKLCKPTILKASSVKRQASSCKDLGIKKETISIITEGMEKACEPGGTGWPLFEFKVKSEKLKVDKQQELSASSSSTRNSELATFNSIPLACKTGTAEFGDPKDRTHAWFTVFAPLPAEVPLSGTKAGLKESPIVTGEPEISVTVLVEAGGEGSSVAAPVAKAILEEWFRR